MKRSICLALALVMAFSLCACGGSKTEKAAPSAAAKTAPAATAKPTPEPTATPEPEDPAAEFYGAWEVVKLETDTAVVTVEQLMEAGELGICNVQLFIAENGAAVYSTLEDYVDGKWTANDKGILIGSIQVWMDGEYLKMSNEKSTLIFSRTSDEQIPDLKKSTAYYCGTWALVGMKDSKGTYTPEELKTQGIPDTSEYKLVFSEDGNAYIAFGKETATYPWEVTDTGVLLNMKKLLLKKDWIVLKGDKNSMYFRKTSDDQTIPEAPENDGLREDFKAAMDAYEAFFDEYVEFMEKYQENSSDMKLMMQYLTILQKMTEYTEAFEKWESSDLNAAELKYYLEVQTRVSKKLIGVAYK